MAEVSVVAIVLAMANVIDSAQERASARASIIPPAPQAGG
jgi:hypothetical protein